MNEESLEAMTKTEKPKTRRRSTPAAIKSSQYLVYSADRNGNVTIKVFGNKDRADAHEKFCKGNNTFVKSEKA